MKSDKNEYEGLIRRPLMMVKKSDENSRALALNQKVGKNYLRWPVTTLFPTRKHTSAAKHAFGHKGFE